MIKDLHTALALCDKARQRECRKPSAYESAPRCCFGSKGHMGESDETLPIAEAQKHARQSFVKAKQRYLLQHPLILGESLGHPVEHLFAKSGIIGQGIVKRLGGNHAPGHISLDHTFGAVMIAVDQTPECLQANRAGADAV